MLSRYMKKHSILRRWLDWRILAERSLIVESRYSGNHDPKFQAKFGVAEDERPTAHG
ncbi:uncharacterized protein METZ01_LOCUS7655 [marine metagenome]|uniref:Uncharacterized protein n=1 Tax=marine metagenome TaxID=408172 RepID=A0A381NJT2_9ZZZZ